MIGENCDNGTSREVIIQAASSGNLESIEKCLKNIIKPTDLFSKVVRTRLPCFSPTPLSIAAMNGHSNILKALVKYYSGAGIFESGCPLHAACMYGKDDCVRILVTSMPHLINEADENGFYPIHTAAEKGHLSAIKVLVEAGADVDKISNVRYLMHRDYGGFTPLYQAASEGYLDIVKFLVNKGADPLLDFKRAEVSWKLFFENDKLCSLSVACAMNHVEVVKYLSLVIPPSEPHWLSAISLSAVMGHDMCLKCLLNETSCKFKGTLRLSGCISLNVWKRIFRTNHAILISSILLEYGVSLQPFVSQIGIQLASDLAGLSKSKMRYLLDAGVIELRCLSLSKETSSLYQFVKYDLLDLHPSFLSEYNFNLISKPYPIYISFFGRNKIVHIPSLSHLCRWSIRVHIAKKYGHVSEKVIKALKLPYRLSQYLQFLER